MKHRREIAGCLSPNFIYFTEEFERKFPVQLSDGAEILLSRVYKLFSFVGHRVLLGDIPCRILSDILKHEEMFKKLLCTCGKFGVSKLGVFSSLCGQQETNLLDSYLKCKEN